MAPHVSPLVSIVVPVYNKARYLRRSVESVLAQSCADLELILVDDGSTDGSLDAARQFTDPRVRVLTQPNAGPGAARNSGIREARAPWIALLDADDAWDPAFLAEMLRLAADFPGCGMYCAPYVFIEPGGVHVLPKWVDVPARGVLASYFRSAALGDLIGTSTSVLVPRAVFDAVGGFPTEKHGEDQDTWTRIALAYPVAAQSGRPLAYYYRETQGRVSHARPAESELPYSVRLQHALDTGKVPAAMRDDAMLYIEAGLITLVSLNARAGQYRVALRLLDDPRIRRFRVRRELWRFVCRYPKLSALGLAIKDGWREGGLSRLLARHG